MKKIILIITLVLIASKLCGQEMAISTNLAGYANFGTLNMEAAYGLSQHWSVNAGIKYNPFSFPAKNGSSQMQNRQQAFAIGTRYWPWHIYSGWWLAGHMQAQQFNVGGIRAIETTEGDRLGGGISAGYTYMLHQHLNLELGVGMWTGYEKFITYACPVCGVIIDSGEKLFLKPNDIILSLTYVF